jgi:hypothetical protein
VRIVRAVLSTNFNPAPLLKPLNTSQRVFGMRVTSSGRSAPHTNCKLGVGSQLLDANASADAASARKSAGKRTNPLARQELH